jgi:hypothetical protein
LSLTWLAKKKMQGEVEFRRHYTAKLRRNYGETTAKLRRNYGETTAKLRRTAELFRAPNPCKHYSSLKVRLMPKKVRLMPKKVRLMPKRNVIYLRGVLCIERATSMQQRGGKGVGGVPGSASIFSSRALRS